MIRANSSKVGYYGFRKMVLRTPITVSIVESLYGDDTIHRFANPSESRSDEAEIQEVATIRKGFE